MTPHRVYFVPGMFGFGRLGAFDYFIHVRAGLEERFRAAGVPVVFENVPAPPTSSLRRRTLILAETISRTAGENDGPLHLVGHSTGGLDVRLLLSPSIRLGIAPEKLRFRGRVRTAITVNAPHYGTPLAAFFATVSGNRLLYAISLLTVLSLSLGKPSLAIFSRLLAGVGGLDDLFDGDLKVFSRLSASLLLYVGDDARKEITHYLGHIKEDQGAIIQIMPEAMDLFNAATEDDPNVRYASVASAAPPPLSLRTLRNVRSPYAAFTAALYSTLYELTSQIPEVYPYAVPSVLQTQLLRDGIELGVTNTSNDGVVPTLSMLWGELIWTGEADHLDVLGHFHDDQTPKVHTDWVTSGAGFKRRGFGSLLDAVAGFQLKAPPGP